MSRPVLYLYGQPVAAAWTREADGQLVAIADLSIPWGREQITDKLEPQFATVRLIDTAFDLDRFAAGALVGAPAMIRREGQHAPGAGTTLIQGVVTSQEATPRVLHDPVADVHREVLDVTITIGDTAAVLSGITRPGTYDGMQLYGTGGIPTRKVPGPWNVGGQDQQWFADRAADLGKHTAWLGTPIQTQTPTYSVAAHPRKRSAATRARPALAGVPSADMPDLWTLVHGLCSAARPMGWPSIQPGVRITDGYPATCAEVTLVRQGGRITVATSMQTARASDLQLDDEGAFPTQTLADLIGAVTVNVSSHRYRWQDALDDAATGRRIREEQMLDDDLSEAITIPVNNGRGSQNVYELPVTLGATHVLPPSPSTTLTAFNESFDGAIGLAQNAAHVAEKLNGWLRLPLLVYEPPAAGPEQSALLQTWDSGPLWLRGHKWAAIGAVPRGVQLIGGTLAWTEDGRWRHELHAAATIDDRPRDLTIAELLQPLNAGFGDFASDLSYADLIHCSRRTAT